MLLRQIPMLPSLVALLQKLTKKLELANILIDKLLINRILGVHMGV